MLNARALRTSVALALTMSALNMAAAVESPNTKRTSAPTDAEAADWGRQLAKSPELLGIEIASLQKKIAALQDKIGALERRRTSVVTTPFEVVDHAGKVRLRVSTNEAKTTLLIFNDKGTPGIGFTTSGESSQFALFSTSGDKLVTIGSHAKGAGLTIGQADGSRFVELDSADGVMVTGKDGKPLVQLSTTGTDSSIDVYSASGGKSVAQLRTSPAGAGRFTLADVDGTITVQAGTTPSGVGLLMLGPDGNGAAATLGNMGLPASKLEGRKKSK